MKGCSAALARLDALPGLCRKALADACREAAREIARDARFLAPVRTGRLRASITAEADGWAARVSARVPYAAAVEEGSLRRPPHPFLGPAAQRADFAGQAARALREVMK